MFIGPALVSVSLRDTSTEISELTSVPGTGHANLVLSIFDRLTGRSPIYRCNYRFVNYMTFCHVVDMLDETRFDNAVVIQEYVHEAPLMFG